MLRLIAVFGLGILIALVLTGVGIRLLNRRPLVLPPRALVGLLAVAFAPPLVGCVGALFAGVPLSELWPLALPIVTLVVILAFFRRILGRVLFLNVDEDMLYDALDDVLGRHGLGYEEERSRIRLKEHDAVVRVHYQATTNSGTLVFSGEESGVLRPVGAELGDALEAKRLPQRSRLAVMYTVLGILLLFGQALPLIMLASR